MAVFRPTQAATRIHGTIGGVVFRNQKHALIVSIKGSPRGRDRTTPRQRTARSALSTAFAGWRALTPSQQAAWRAFSLNLGNPPPEASPQPVGGREYYVRHKLLGQRSGVATPASPDPSATFNVGPWWFALRTNAAGTQLELRTYEAWEDPYLDTNARVALEWAPSQSPSREKRRGAWTPLGSVNPYTQATPFGAPAVFALPTPVEPGGWVYVRARAVSSFGPVSRTQSRRWQHWPTGLTTAFRVRPIFSNASIDHAYAYVTPDGFLELQDIVSEPGGLIRIPLNVPAGRSVTSVYKAVNATATWMALDLNAATQSRPATQLISQGQQKSWPTGNPADLWITQ